MFTVKRCLSNSCFQRAFNSTILLPEFNKIGRKDIIRYVYDEKTLSLAFTRYKSVDKSSAPQTPVVILHGMLGSKRNWTTFSRNFNKETGREVIAVDCRNHGQSQHSGEMTLDLMSYDIARLLKQLHIPKVILIGHSMGGKVVVNMALSLSEYVEKLVVVDVGLASREDYQDEFYMIVNAMLDVTEAKTQSKQEADDILVKHNIKNADLRSFLLTNLKRCSYQDVLIWRCNILGIWNNISNLTKAVTLDGRAPYEGETLFVAGGDSHYVSAKDLPNIRTMLPKAHLEIIPGAGHFVHIDKPKELLILVKNFVSSS